MRKKLKLFVVLLVGASLPSWADPLPGPDVPCKVTHSNGVMAGMSGRREGSYGNALLSAGPFGLWPDGTIIFEPGGPGFITPDGALGMKFGWMRGIDGKLKVTGRRLDGAAQALRFETSDGYGETGFQASYLIFPTPGCWEVTAQLAERDDSKITFVTRVIKRGEGPAWRPDGPLMTRLRHERADGFNPWQ